MSVTHYNNELGEVVEYEMLDPQCLAEMTPLNKIQSFINKSKRNGYCSPDLPDFNNLCTSVKVDVFNKDLKITIHVGLLHPLLPPPSVIHSDMVYEFYDPEYMTGLYQRKAQTL